MLLRSAVNSGLAHFIFWTLPKISPVPQILTKMEIVHFFLFKYISLIK